MAGSTEGIQPALEGACIEHQDASRFRSGKHELQHLSCGGWAVRDTLRPVASQHHAPHLQTNAAPAPAVWRGASVPAARQALRAAHERSMVHEHENCLQWQSLMAGPGKVPVVLNVKLSSVGRKMSNSKPTG